MISRARHPWSAILAPLVAGFAVAAICIALYQGEASQIKINTLDREARRTEIFAHFFEGYLQSAIKDLRQLADGDGLKAFLISGKQADLDRAIHRAQFVSQLNPDYDQVRYLDEKGQEIIRVNFNGAVVPPDQLQNKADRTYFQKANALAPGQFYISAFDLNVEKGQIEQPLKPVIRVAAPIFDSSGQRRGIYIINYLGANILTRLQKFTPQYQQRLRVLNAQGYWLKASQPEQEWGFMFPGRDGLTMAQADPALWSQILGKTEGQMPHAGGYFTWYRVVPGEIENGKAEIMGEDAFLLIASEISPVEWSAYFAGLRQTFLIVSLVLLALFIVSWMTFRSRQQAQQERDRFFVLTRDLLCIAGFDGYFKRLNPAWENTFGYTRQELLEKPFLDFVHPDDLEKTRTESAKLKDGGESISFENRYRCKDGSYRWLLWSARSLVGDKLIFASARDLTERKGIESEVLKLNDELKQRAEQLETANRELEAFSYSVSHDLRAPLRHIHGFVELLQKSPVLEAEESSRRQLGIIAKAARQMGLLIDDLLAFSKTGRAEMHPVKIDSRELIDNVLLELEMDMKDRKVTWDIKPLPTVMGDPALLRLVWMNLLSNALKYTRPRDEAKIEIGSINDGVHNPGGREAVFYVRDNGVGFDMQYSTKLFGVFQRLHTADNFEGTGIGLANVQRIIHRHGGRVWAEARVESGATFYFSLPLTQTVKNHA